MSILDAWLRLRRNIQVAPGTANSDVLLAAIAATEGVGMTNPKVEGDS
jgi:hypothetical protein